MAHEPVFEHAMLREISEQPQALSATVEHDLHDGNLNAEVFRDAAEAFRRDGGHAGRAASKAKSESTTSSKKRNR